MNIDDERDNSPPVVIGGLEKLEALPEEVRDDISDVLGELGGIFANSLATGMKTVLTSIPMSRIRDANDLSPWWISYGPAVRYSAEAATKGELNEIYNLGIYHRYGHGTKQDDEKALAFFIEASKEDHPLAALELGMMLERGLAVQKAPHQAIAYFERAAAFGSAEARYRLGALLRQGHGTTIRIPEGRFWLECAAKQNWPLAMFELALMLAQGEGGPIDLIAALKWLNRAAIHSDAASIYLKSYRSTISNGIPTSQSNSQRGQGLFQRGFSALWGVGRQTDAEEARDLLEYAARIGHPAAQYHLGWMYAQGVGTKPDLRVARRWLGRAMRRGYPAAAYDYATLPNQSVAWAADALKRAVSAGHVGSKFLLGRAYIGYGSAVDDAGEWRLARGRRLLEEAAMAGDDRAIVETGFDRAGEAEWFERIKQAAERGSLQAQKLLAVLTEDKDPEAAFCWWSNAAMQGDLRSMENVIKHLLKRKKKAEGPVLIRYLTELMLFRPKIAMYFAATILDEAPQPDWGWEPLFKRYGKLAKFGDLTAIRQLAQLHEYGLGTTPDPIRAMELYQSVLDQARTDDFYENQDFQDAQRGMARLLERDLANCERAFQIRQSLANSTSRSEDVYDLAIMHLEGRGTRADVQEGVRCLEQIDWLPTAAFKLGELFESGQAGTQDMNRAREYFSRAAEGITVDRKSAVEAMQRLGELAKTDTPENAYWWFSLANSLGEDRKGVLRELRNFLSPRQRRRASVAIARWKSWHCR